MKSFFCLISLLLYASVAFTQNVELTDEEKANLKNNLKSISADSALKICVHTLAVMSFKDVEARNKKSLWSVIEIINQLESVNGPRSEYYSWKASAYSLLENSEQAIMQQSRAIRLEPSNARLYKLRADMKAKIENYYGAIADYSKTISLGWKDSEAYTKRGWCYIMTQQWEFAMADAEKAISLDKMKGENYLIRGVVHIQFNRKRQGCLDFDKAGDLGEPRAFQAIKDFCTQEDY